MADTDVEDESESEGEYDGAGYAGLDADGDTIMHE